MTTIGKRAQMNLSFGMIFSIILIIVFISFAFYAIGKFLDIQKFAKTGQFISALESDVNQMWDSDQGSQELEYSLPTSVDYVCFTYFSEGVKGKGLRQDFYDDFRFVQHEKDENMFFYPVGSAGSIDSTKMDNIDLIRITSLENPYCIQNIKGNIKLTIKKGTDENLVTITR